MKIYFPYRNCILAQLPWWKVTHTRQCWKPCDHHGSDSGLAWKSCWCVCRRPESRGARTLGKGNHGVMRPAKGASLYPLSPLFPPLLCPSPSLTCACTHSVKRGGKKPVPPVSFICNSEKLETSQISFSGWTVKHLLLYPHNVIQLSKKKETTDTRNNLQGYWVWKVHLRRWHIMTKL